VFWAAAAEALPAPAPGGCEAVASNVDLEHLGELEEQIRRERLGSTDALAGAWAEALQARRASAGFEAEVSELTAELRRHAAAAEGPAALEVRRRDFHGQGSIVAEQAASVHGGLRDGLGHSAAGPGCGPRGDEPAPGLEPGPVAHDSPAGRMRRDRWLGGTLEETSAATQEPARPPRAGSLDLGLARARIEELEAERIELLAEARSLDVDAEAGLPAATALAGPGVGPPVAGRRRAGRAAWPALSLLCLFILCLGGGGSASPPVGRGAGEETSTSMHWLEEVAAVGEPPFPVIHMNDFVLGPEVDDVYGCRHQLPDRIARACGVARAGTLVLLGGYGDVGRGRAVNVYGCRRQLPFLIVRARGVMMAGGKRAPVCGYGYDGNGDPPNVLNEQGRLNIIPASMNRSLADYDVSKAEWETACMSASNPNPPNVMAVELNEYGTTLCKDPSCTRSNSRHVYGGWLLPLSGVGRAPGAMGGGKLRAVHGTGGFEWPEEEAAAGGELLIPVTFYHDFVTEPKVDNVYGCRHQLPDPVVRACGGTMAGSLVLLGGYGDAGMGSAGAGHGTGGFEWPEGEEAASGELLTPVTFYRGFVTGPGSDDVYGCRRQLPVRIVRAFGVMMPGGPGLLGGHGDVGYIFLRLPALAAWLRPGRGWRHGRRQAGARLRQCVAGNGIFITVAVQVSDLRGVAWLLAA